MSDLGSPRVDNEERAASLVPDQPPAVAAESSPPAPGSDQGDDSDDGREEQVKRAVPMQTLDDIFAEADSDLSDLSGDEDDQPQSPAPAVRVPVSRSPSPAQARSSSPAARDQSAEPGADGDDNDEYRETDVRKLSKIKRKKRAEGESGEREPPQKKKKTKKSRDVVEEEEEEVLDEPTRRRRELNSRLDEIVKPKKKIGGKKKGGNQDDDLELLNDEAVARLRSDMFHAADKDTVENENGRPAIYKLRMLPQVVDMMQKSALAESLVENGTLEAVKKWLEPLPDRSLPAINIQRPLFEILRTLSIETSALKSSGLGKIVYFYTKCKRVEPYIARMANQLVSDWMRPIIRRSKAFVDKDTSVSATTASYEAHRPRTGRPLNPNVAKRQQAEGSQGSGGGAVARRHARIPEQLTQSFKVAPAADPRERPERSGGVGQSIGAGSGGAKMRSYKKKLVAGQQASRRV